MAYFFSDGLKSDIISANDIVDVISDYVQLKKSGRNLLGLCPFHNEKTPSFAVNPEKQIFKCFGCGEGGDAVSFLMKIERLDFQEALLSLAERAHISVEEAKSSDNSYPKTDKERMYFINAEAARFFNSKLYTESGALEYVKNRNLSANTLTRFGIGFAPESWDALIKHMKGLSVTEEELYKAGLVSKKDTRYFDAFRNRIIFPIIDVKGHVVGFGGRVLDDSKPKYLNSPETPVFDKSRNFYGLNFARIDNHRTAVIVEGYMDVIALHQAGITNAIATLGTSFTEEHGKILKRYFDYVVLAFDSDDAGRKATDRCISILNNIDGLKVRVLVQNMAKDPDEYIKQYGKDAFLGLVKNAPRQLEYRISRIKEGLSLSDVEDKIRFVSESAAFFAEIKNDIEREAYVKKIARESDISEDAIFSEINKITGKATRYQRFVQPKVLDRKSPLSQASEMLLSLIYGDRSLYESVSQIIDKSFFDSEVYGSIYELLGKYDNLTANFDKLTEEQRGVVVDISVRDDHIEDKRKCAAELIEKINYEKSMAAFQKTKESDDIELLKNLLATDKRAKKGNS